MGGSDWSEILHTKILKMTSPKKFFWKIFAQKDENAESAMEKARCYNITIVMLGRAYSV